MKMFDKKEYMNEYNKTHREEHNQSDTKRRNELKTQVLTHYGNGKLACVHCGFSDIDALCLDHINGKIKRLSNGRRQNSTNLFYQLKQEGYSAGFQTLCANCNLIKFIRGKEYEVRT